MNIRGLRQSLLPGAMICLLAISVVLLGAIAKHSQYPSPNYTTYLAKAVKMSETQPGDLALISPVAVPCLPIPAASVLHLQARLPLLPPVLRIELQSPPLLI